jgi:hypothetical protein
MQQYVQIQYQELNYKGFWRRCVTLGNPVGFFFYSVGFEVLTAVATKSSILRYLVSLI